MLKKTFQVVYGLIGLVLILSLFACDNGSGSSASRETPEEDTTGSLSFTIEWGDEAPDAGTTSRAAVDCVGRGLATIDVILYNGADEVVASRSWPCDAHGGTMDGIPAPQSELTLLLMGKNTDGNVTYRGTKGDLSIEAGRTNEAGAVDVFYFVPPSVTLSGTANGFQWNEVHGAAKYRVTISASEDFSAVAETGDVDTASYTATQLDPGQEYFVKVYAIGAYDNESEASEISSFTTLALSAIPQNVSAGDDLMKVDLTWEGESDGRYNLYWSTSPGVTKETHEGKIEDIEALSYTHENLQGNTVYYYVVTSENSVGQESAVSAEVSATAVGHPTGPENVSATAGDRQVALSWTTAPGFVYNIYWGTQPGVSKDDHQEKIAGVAGGSWVHADCASTAHYYIVTAENELGESDPLGEVSAAPGWLELLTDELNEEDESAKDIAVDAEGNTYVLGFTDSRFEEQITAGRRDVLLVKYDPQGVRQWVRLIGSDLDDYVNNIGLDAAGNYYLAGTTYGDWDGFENPYGSGTRYHFIVKLNPEGERQWIQAFDPSGNETEIDNYLAVDADGNAYLTGTVERTSDEGTSDDIFILKYDADGHQVWEQYYEESTNDESHAIAVDDSGGVYVTGEAGSDLLVLKYSGAGQEEWRNLRSSSEYSIGTAIAVRGDACYVSGAWTWDSTNISRYDPADGTHLWTEVVEGVRSGGVAIGPTGNVVFTGHTELASFDGQDNVTEGDTLLWDILLMSYNGEGRRLWSRLFGSSAREFGDAIAMDTAGYAYITGVTWGDLGGRANSGRFDIYTWKIYPGP